MADYTVELEGHVFSSSPATTLVAERLHRLDENPITHRVSTFTIELERCRVPTADGTPDGAVDALVAFLQACAHKSIIPTYLRIKDAGGTVLPEIGDIHTGNTSEQWEELLITRIALPASVAQLKAGAEFSITLTARRTFATADGLVECEREWSSDAGVDGREVRTLRSRIVMRRGTAVPTGASWLLALVRQAAPAGWVRLTGNLPGTNTIGASVVYPRHGQAHEAQFFSQVQRLSGGVVAPTGAGDAVESTVRRDRPDLGLVEVLTRAEATGAVEPEAYLEGKVPPGGVGERSVAKGGRAEAAGTWRTYELAGLPLAGKTNRVTVTRQLLEGGRPVVVTPIPGFLPTIRRGPPAEWRLVETVEAFALGAMKTMLEFPTLSRLPKPWVVDPAGTFESLPRLAERGATADQDRWERVSVRVYVWDGEVAPLEDESFRKLLLPRLVAGEEGVSLA